ncbi:MAG: EVE domain protein [bacterium ADurb.BinA186]|nr:MAG: EVE domain protein [bacterium ADurb.BinA186]
MVKTAYPDPTALEGEWYAVDVAFQKYLARPVKLSELKLISDLSNLSLIRQGRLSVCPVTKHEWDMIESIAQS